MTRIALACTVMLASLFTFGAQADAHGFKRHTPHVIHYNIKRHKFYKSQKQYRAVQRYRHRFVVKRLKQNHKYHYARRYR
jgi:hypothetical protein